MEIVDKIWKDSFDEVREFVSLHTIDYKILRMNKALAEFTGLEAGEMGDKFCYNAIHGTDAPLNGCPHAEMLETKDVVTREVFDEKKNLRLLVTSIPIFNGGSEIEFVMHIARDISDRKGDEDLLMWHRLTNSLSPFR